MKNSLLILLILFLFQGKEKQKETQVLQEPMKYPEVLSMVPTPPSVNALPELEKIRSILNSEFSLEDVRREFKELPPYKGSVVLLPPKEVCGIWSRVYTQETVLFDISAVAEEIISIEPCGHVFWIQHVRTNGTANSLIKRSLQVAHYDLLGHMFFVFHYTHQNPCSQSVRNKQGFFIRVLSDHGFMQMSTSPKFEEDRSLYWKKLPAFYMAQSCGN